MSGRLVRALATFVSAAAVTLAQLALPSREFWEASPELLYGATGVVALATTSQVATLVTDIATFSRVRSYDEDLRSLLSKTIAEVARVSGAPWDEIGVHVFRRRVGLPRTRLVNAGGMRMGSGLSMDRPRWFTGKGVIGISFARRESKAVAWKADVARARNNGKAEWESLSAAERYGLSWGELLRTPNYPCICAYPMYDRRDRLRGVVSVDAPLDVDVMNGGEMEVVMGAFATQAADLGKPPAGWRRRVQV